MSKPQSFDELVVLFGKPWEGDSAYHEFEQKHLAMWRSEVWEKNTGKSWCLPFKRIYCNQLILPILDQTFQILDTLGLICELKTFDGCFNVRKVRGSEEKYSIHSFGLAIDFNASENPLGGPVKFSRKFLSAMEACGWTCGAYFTRQDGMHFQYADHC